MPTLKKNDPICIVFDGHIFKTDLVVSVTKGIANTKGGFCIKAKSDTNGLFSDSAGYSKEWRVLTPEIQSLSDNLTSKTKQDNLDFIDAIALASKLAKKNDFWSGCKNKKTAL